MTETLYLTKTYTMRYFLTVSDAQNALAQKVKDELVQNSMSSLFIALLLHYEQTKRRALGRPKSDTEQDQNDNDDVPMYKTPDYDLRGAQANKNIYSYNDLAAWYTYRNQEMPSRDALALHPDYKSNL